MAGTETSETTVFPDSFVYSYLTTWDISVYIFNKIGEVVVILIGFVLLLCNLLGFSIYILYMRKDEANKDRLLNVLYANLSICYQVAVVGLFVYFLLLETFDDTESLWWCLLIRWRLFFGLFTTLLFLQISMVTSINHYNPGLYLHLSLHWRRIPVLCFQFLIALVVLGLLEFVDGFNGLCMLKEVKENYAHFILPLMILNLLLQLGVVVDSYWGWRRVWRVVVTMCGNTNTVHPENGVELDNLQQNGVGPQHIHPSGDESSMHTCNLLIQKVYNQILKSISTFSISLQDHVSITAGFVTYTVSLITSVVQSFMFLTLEAENAFYHCVLPLLIHAFIPMFWIYTNDNMKRYLYEILRKHIK